MNQSGQLKTPDTTYLVRYDSKERLLSLTSDLLDRLNDTITLNHLKDLCSAIVEEITLLQNGERTV